MNYTKISRAASLRSARIAADIQTLINNRSYYKFQYTPLTGPLPGLSFEQQTEDAINDIGNMSYGSYEIATQALTTANQAYNAAQSAIEIANHAETTAQNAQTTANNAATAAAGAQETADNAATAAAEAQTTADNAATAAADAQTTADNAQASANTAIEKATDAQTTADNAQNDATSALEKLNRIEPIVDELRYYNDIPDAFDFNTKTEFAREYIQSTECTNAPVPSKGWLDVDDDFDDTIIRQKFIADVDGACYVRFGTIVPDSSPIEVSSWTDWVKYVLASDLNGAVDNLTEQVTEVSTALTAHKDDHNNPHQVTAAQLGLATVYKYKGSVETYADLPTSGQQVGDVYNIKQADPDHNIEAGDNVAWDGTAWDILAGDTDLSGYAQLNSANTFTAANTFNANVTVRAATAAGSGGVITLGAKPAGKTYECLINAAGNGNLILQSSENGIVALQSGSVLQWSVVSDEANSKTSAYLHSNLAATYTPATGPVWEGVAASANKLAIPRTINGVPFDGTKDINIEAGGGGGGDVTAAGDNNFTGTNTFNKAITVRDGALAGIGGTITLGMKPNSATTQAKINSTTTGAMYYTATEGLAHFFNVGTTEVANIGGTATTATLDFLANRILNYSTSSGLRVGGGGTSKIIGFYPEAADNTAGMRLSNQAEAISTDYSIFSLQNNSAINYANNAALQVGSFKFLEIDKTTQNLTLSVNGVKNGTANILFESSGDRLAQIDYNGTLSLKENLIVGSTANTNLQNGVIRAGNSENCLYFCGTAENTYYSTPNTGNVILYQPSANCYLINCAINNPSSLTMNFEGMDFKATVGSVPYMCKTLTFWLAVGATVPTVAWTFPTGSAVYYPKGVAPALTANANNIINVIAIVDDTGSFSIQVCDSVALPFSG